MSINNIELNGVLLNELYRNTLIEEPGLMTISTAAKEPAKEAGVSQADDLREGFKWLGNNQKSILLLVNHPDTVYLPDDDLKFLTGILGACKLSLDDVAVMNLAKHPEAVYKEIISFFKSRVVLLFDIEPASIGLPLNFPHFQLQAFAGNTFLYSPSLPELEDDKILKSKLWVCLKRLFNL